MRLIAMAASRGYWGTVHQLAHAAILSKNNQSWMSTLPSEVESQEIGLDAAHGHTVIFGLGMGWLAANAALRPAVDCVTVVERDPDIIELAEEIGAFDGLPDQARRKVRIVEGDAREWRPQEAVHSLQADIWRRFTEDGKLAEVRRMHANVAAPSIYFWGQEMEIWRHACRRAGRPPDTLNWDDVRAIVRDDLQLPLTMPDWEDYPAKIASAAQWWAPQDDAWWRRD